MTAATAVRPCMGHDCSNEARPRHALCHACAKRRQRGSRRRQPRYASHWERLAAAALRYATAEAEEEYLKAEAVLRMAALHYGRKARQLTLL